nr:MAG: hypothetical protein B6I27_01645 [Erwiniaceae bacterium 4572_131]
MQEYSKTHKIYYKNLMQVKVLDQKVIKKYIESYQKFGDKVALKKIIDSNKRYINFMAVRRKKTTKLDLFDLISEGTIGLINAIKAFDLTRNNTFLSFATSRINKEMLMYIDTYSTDVHIPYNIVTDTNKIKKATAKYYKKLGYNPPIEWLEKETKLSIDVIKKCLNYVNCKDNSSSIDDEFPDNNDMKNNVINLLKFLKEEQQRLLIDYFGLLGKKKKKYTTIIKEYEFSSKEELEQEINRILIRLKKIK